MTIFDIIADYYDDSILNGRFNHDDVVKRLEPFIKEAPIFITDLASGTGGMADALHRKWPLAKVICEEPSVAMIKLLKGKFPDFPVHCTTLQETQITSQDLVTVAFNSINYIEPNLLFSVFKRIHSGTRVGGVLYFDALTKESALYMLNGKPFMEKVTKRGELTVCSRLTSEILFHRFSLDNGYFEEHAQYIVSEQEYLRLLLATNFEVLHVQSLPGTLRTEFVCKSVNKNIYKI
ncbi:MAG: class I SAM-dependent methyltransferase [Candidatus Gracilibacteria bacterium]